MILLDKNEYCKVIDLFKTVPFNTLVPQAVLDDHIFGKIFVNDKEDPSTFLIVHPYGLSLLLGSTENEDFNQWLVGFLHNKENYRKKYDWLQAYPDEWNAKLHSLPNVKMAKINLEEEDAEDGVIVENTRVNFNFNVKKFQKSKNKISDKGLHIARTDREMYRSMSGAVLPKYFWKSEDHFINSGVGFSLMTYGNQASMAFSTFITDNILEIGIETVEKYQGNGYATHTCIALIDYCIENDYEPVWSCRKENAGSFYLATKLGFEPTLYFPCYKLLV